MAILGKSRFKRRVDIKGIIGAYFFFFFLIGLKTSSSKIRDLLLFTSGFSNN